MFIEYDSSSQVVYLKLKHGEVVKTKEYKKEIFLDFDKHNKLLGIELLNLEDSLYLPEIAHKFSAPSLKKVHAEHLEEVYA
ncbi:MAG: DUF2283 domain-containing protein [Candidatus Omnitrophica bacterium]|nr:DUF2283 domain-containing protein [Candidatus Omnitrophota bacterium]